MSSILRRNRRSWWECPEQIPRGGRETWTQEANEDIIKHLSCARFSTGDHWECKFRQKCYDDLKKRKIQFLYLMFSAQPMHSIFHSLHLLKLTLPNAKQSIYISRLLQVEVLNLLTIFLSWVIMISEIPCSFWSFSVSTLGLCPACPLDVLRLLLSLFHSFSMSCL